jgi:peptidoglycan/LPS O-acetylase OafA/YrhL
VKRIPSLDGLRAISIALVVLAHLSKSGHASPLFRANFGGTGVRIFFVISGYLITTILLKEHSHTATISLREFYLRRAFRIFPAAIVFLFVATVVYWHDLRWYHIASAGLYVANYDLARPWIFGHLWSLSIEEQFYLLWPSVLKKWYAHRVKILLGALVLAPLWQAASLLLKIPVVAWSFPALADYLAIGCLLAIFAPRLPKIHPLGAVTMCAALICIPFFPAYTAGRTLLALFVLHPAYYVSIAGVILHVVQTPYRWLNWAPLTWLGRISYSLYLWQQPFCADPQLHSGYFVLFAVGCACASYYLVEQPMLRWRERLADSSRSPVPLRVSATAA